MFIATRWRSWNVLWCVSRLFVRGLQQQLLTDIFSSTLLVCCLKRNAITWSVSLFVTVPDFQSKEQITIKEDNDVSMDSMEEFQYNEAKLSLKSLGLDPETIALQTLDGFLIILSADGDVTYVSENVNEYLGISQVSKPASEHFNRKRTAT